MVQWGGNNYSYLAKVAMVTYKNKLAAIYVAKYDLFIENLIVTLYILWNKYSYVF